MLHGITIKATRKEKKREVYTNLERQFYAALDRLMQMRGGKK